MKNNREDDFQENIPASADWLELDNNSNVIGRGTDADYQDHALQVMNGEGYYDEEGHYHSYRLYG